MKFFGVVHRLVLFVMGTMTTLLVAAGTFAYHLSRKYGPPPDKELDDASKWLFAAAAAAALTIAFDVFMSARARVKRA